MQFWYLCASSWIVNSLRGVSSSPHNILNTHLQHATWHHCQLPDTIVLQEVIATLNSIEAIPFNRLRNNTSKELITLWSFFWTFNNPQQPSLFCEKDLKILYPALQVFINPCQDDNSMDTLKWSLKPCLKILDIYKHIIGGTLHLMHRKQLLWARS